MYAKGSKKGTIRFSISAPQAKNVALAGEFNGWDAQKMRKNKDGQWVANVELAAGHHEYKFIIDGQWQTDPDNDAFAINVHGTSNSVAVV